MEKNFTRAVPLFLISALAALPLSVQATRGGMETSKEVVEQEQAKAVMGNVYGAYTKLLPYIYSTNPTATAPKMKQSKSDLVKNLTDLSEIFKSAKHADFFKRPGFRPSLETINNHLEETIITVQSGNFIFAQKRLNVLGALCVSCHSQIPQSVAKNAFGDNVVKESRESFDSDLSYANYLYLVRRFDESRTFFEKAINDGLDKNSRYSHQELLSALRTALSIDTKITFNADKTEFFIKKWEGDKRLSSSDRKMLSRWKTDLSHWKSFTPAEVKSIPDFISKHLVKLDMKKELMFSGEDDVTLYVSAGVLQNYLVEHPSTDMTPEVLYWLSIIERRMNNTYFFSLGDLYLKDCITKYPASAYAKKCYQEYADSIEAGYSGSSGTDIPLEERKEMARLKALLK
jgi:hypothetical protein